MAITDSARHAYRSAAERLGVLNTSAVTFTRCRAAQSAASLAYYAFFSIFPLMLLLILAGSYFLDRQSVVQRVTEAVQSALPVSQQFIVQNLQQVLKQRTAVGIFVLASLLWSASNVFNNLAYDVNEAWPEARERGFLQARLIGLDIVLGLTVLILASIALDSLAKWLGASVQARGGSPSSDLWAVLSSLGSWLAVLLLYLAMYHWVPTAPVTWPASAWGALAASVGWKAATTAFAWYLGSPFAHYELVYGSLSAVVAFLFLIYIIAVITLFGAHLTAAVDHLQRKDLSPGAPAAPNAGPGRQPDEPSGNGVNGSGSS